MEPTDHGSDDGIAGQALHVSDDVDDARVAAAAEHDQTAVGDPEHKSLIVEDERVGLPRRAAGSCLVTLESRLEPCRAVDFAGNEHGAVEEKRRPPIFHDREARAFECGTARRWKLGRLHAG